MIYYLSLGSNLGNREETLSSAIRLIEERIGKVTKRSSFFYSKPWGFSSCNDFCNLCLILDTPLQPLEVLLATQEIERLLGRTKKSLPTSPSYSDRPIDIDLLQAFASSGDEVICQTAQLTLPHPLMHQRDFVMIPLRELLQ